MAKKNARSMKVCGQSGYKYKTVPAITLKGKWLEELGFHLGGYVQVKCENGQLIITRDVNKAQEKVAKTAFMEEEIRKLEIRYLRMPGFLAVPDPPFFCYLLPGSENFAADGGVYF